MYLTYAKLQLCMEIFAHFLRPCISIQAVLFWVIMIDYDCDEAGAGPGGRKM